MISSYAAYQGWCRDNNRGYAKSAREFKEELAAYLGVPASSLTVRRREGMVYRAYTLSVDAADNYVRGIVYCSDSVDEEFMKEGESA